MYPPRVKMTVTIKNHDSAFKLPIKVLGCSSESNLNVELTIPLGMTIYLYAITVLTVTMTLDIMHCVIE